MHTPSDPVGGERLHNWSMPPNTRVLTPVLAQSRCLDRDLSGPCSVCLRDSDGQHTIGIGRLHLVPLYCGGQCKGALEWAVQALNVGVITSRLRVSILALTGDHHCGTVELDGDVLNRHPWYIGLNNVCRIGFVHIDAWLPWPM